MILLRLSNSPLRGVRILKVGSGVIQNATITGRQTRGGPLPLMKPFPYQDKKYRWYDNIFDNTMVRVSQENARIIAVEGPIGVGKTAFCKALAEEFDMFYMPQIDMDVYYLLPSGYDLRQHDHQVPERVRTYDHKNFCQSPKDIKAGGFQLNMQNFRFFQYLDAFCHLLNTGQGVVIERSYFSDFVFAKAMYEQKYISKPVLDCYLTLEKQTRNVFPPPHLTIYLDIPVPVVQERIRTRNYSYEQNAPALTPEYLASLEKFWKQEYLREARVTSDVLVYDWTDGGDIDVVIDDIEKLDLDTMRSDGKFLNWWLSRTMLYKLRQRVTNQRGHYMYFFSYPYHRVDELFVRDDLSMIWNEIYLNIPELRYDIGYNYFMGDSIFKILLSDKVQRHRLPKYHYQYLDIQ